MSVISGKVLIVDDDVYLLEIMKEMLISEGYHILTAQDGKSALDIFNKIQPDIVLLDIKLPDIDGYTICKHIKKASNVPVIMVTSKVEASEEVEGLYVGADDYITKPFPDSILIARVKAMLRRNPNNVPSKVLKTGKVEIDFFRQTVKVDEAELDLTTTEFKIFTFLLLNEDKIISQSSIIQEISGEESRESIHSLQVNISRLRKKFTEYMRKAVIIETFPSGYSLRIIR
jgi:two-component system, OmpR family, response regulator